MSGSIAHRTSLCFRTWHFTFSTTIFAGSMLRVIIVTMTIWTYFFIFFFYLSSSITRRTTVPFAIFNPISFTMTSFAINPSCFHNIPIIANRTTVTGSFAFRAATHTFPVTPWTSYFPCSMTFRTGFFWFLCFHNFLTFLVLSVLRQLPCTKKEVACFLITMSYSRHRQTPLLKHEWWKHATWLLT